MSDADIIQLARKAICRTLLRIKENEKVRYECGLGTQTFEDLCVALGAIDKKSPRAIAALILKCTENEAALVPESVEDAL